MALQLFVAAPVGRRDHNDVVGYDDFFVFWCFSMLRNSQVAWGSTNGYNMFSIWMRRKLKATEIEEIKGLNFEYTMNTKKQKQ